MTVGIYTIELHLPMARSLKNKRQVVKRLKDRLRARYNVAVAEMEEHADLWQRAAFAVVSIASSRDALVRLFESVHREAEAHVPGHVMEIGTEFLEGMDRDVRGDWS